MAQSCASANQKELNYPVKTLLHSEVNLAECMERTSLMLGYQEITTRILYMAWRPFLQKLSGPLLILN
jgi:hypothetical protein